MTYSPYLSKTLTEKSSDANLLTIGKGNKFTKTHVEEVRSTLTSIVSFVAQSKEQVEYRKAVANFRNIPVDILDDLNCFYVPTTSYIRTLIGDVNYLNKDLGFVNTYKSIPYPVFNERFIFPCYDIKRKVSGLVGYDNVHKYKYLLNNTLAFEKSTVTFGYSELDFIYSKKYVILVEGVFDWLRLRSLGLPVLCLQGTIIFPNLLRILNRLETVILLYDSDNAGVTGSIESQLLIERKCPITRCIRIQLGTTTDLEVRPSESVETTENTEQLEPSTQLELHETTEKDTFNESNFIELPKIELTKLNKMDVDLFLQDETNALNLKTLINGIVSKSVIQLPYYFVPNASMFNKNLESYNLMTSYKTLSTPKNRPKENKSHVK